MNSNRTEHVYMLFDQDTECRALASIWHKWFTPWDCWGFQTSWLLRWSLTCCHHLHLFVIESIVCVTSQLLCCSLCCLWQANLCQINMCVLYMIMYVTTLTINHLPWAGARTTINVCVLWWLFMLLWGQPCADVRLASGYAIVRYQ